MEGEESGFRCGMRSGRILVLRCSARRCSEVDTIPAPDMSQAYESSRILHMLDSHTGCDDLPVRSVLCRLALQWIHCWKSRLLNITRRWHMTCLAALLAPVCCATACPAHGSLSLGLTAPGYRSEGVRTTASELCWSWNALHRSGQSSYHGRAIGQEMRSRDQATAATCCPAGKPPV